MHTLLTTTETAQVLDVSERMVHYYVKTKRLKPAQQVGRCHLFDPVKVAELKPTLIRRKCRNEVAA